MEKGEQLLLKMREIVSKNPDGIQIVETNVDADVQIAFYEKMQSVSDDTKYGDIKIYEQQLFDESVSDEQKKDTLVMLASNSSVEDFRLVEKFMNACKPELKNWALLAYQQCRMFLESSLLDEEKIYVASGLGGKDMRLRYVLALSKADRSNFDSVQTHIAKGEFEYALKNSDSIVEDISFDGSFVVCKALIPIYENVLKLAQDICDEINQYGKFLSEDIFVTNERLITTTDLIKIFYE